LDEEHDERIETNIVRVKMCVDLYLCRTRRERR
jgi:hypothetical protein